MVLNVQQAFVDPSAITFFLAKTTLPISTPEHLMHWLKHAMVALGVRPVPSSPFWSRYWDCLPHPPHSLRENLCSYPDDPWVASLSSDQFPSEIYFMSIHYHFHCQRSHPPWPLAWTTMIDSKLAHCRKKCFCLFVLFLNGYIWLFIWLKRTRVVWSLVTSSASSFSTWFSATSALFMPVFIHCRNMLWPPREGYLSPDPHSPTHPETRPPDSVSGWPPRQTWCLFPGIQILVYSPPTVYGVGLCDQKNEGEVMVYVTPRLGYKTPPLPSWSCAHILTLLDYLLWGKPALMWEPRTEASCPEPWKRSSNHPATQSSFQVTMAPTNSVALSSGGSWSKVHPVIPSLEAWHVCCFKTYFYCFFF